MILGGVARLMAPQPPTPKDAEKERSFLFSGLRSTSDEDQPVPLIYGRCFVPLKLEISRQVTTTEERLT
jgi:predicted phage tail protein